MNKPLFTMSASELQGLLEKAIYKMVDTLPDHVQTQIIGAETHGVVEDLAREVVVGAMYMGAKSFP